MHNMRQNNWQLRKHVTTEWTIFNINNFSHYILYSFLPLKKDFCRNICLFVRHFPTFDKTAQWAYFSPLFSSRSFFFSSKDFPQRDSAQLFTWFFSRFGLLILRADEMKIAKHRFIARSLQRKPNRRKQRTCVQWYVCDLDTSAW